ncbi:50S ribosomal protein L29 [cyanobacterium TDX16]|nr:50S ribosomal protein L29 [cyanobacterium TDX16]
MAKQSSVRDLSDAELVARLGEVKQELFDLRFQHATGQLDDTAKLGRVRKDVARVNTEIREREIAAAEALEENDG